MKSILGFFLSALAIFAPIKGLVLLLTCLICMDTVFGIYTSIKIGGVHAFKSNKLFNVVVKSFFYVGTLLLLFMVDKFVFDGQLFGINFLLSKAVAIFWCYIELKSLDENSMKLGNRSVWVIAKEAIKKYKDFKKDLGK
jgi:hypothetical protein